MKVLTNLDLVRNQLVNGVIQKVETDPTTKLTAGWVIFNTTDAKLKVYDGEDWVPLGSGGGGSVDIATTISETSTNSKAAGAKAVYDFVTDNLADIRAVANGKVLIVDETTGDVVGIEIDTAVTEDSTKLILSGQVYSAIQDALGNVDAMKFKGTIGADGTITSSDTDLNGNKLNELTEFKSGWTFKASADIPTTVLNTDKAIETGDIIMVLGDATSYASSNITVIQNNLDGVVTGPATSLDETIAVFDGTTGKVIKASSITKDQLEALFDGIANLESETDASDVFISSSNTADNTVLKPGQTASAHLKATGVDADTYGDNSGVVDAELDDGDSFKIPQFTVDAKGRLTAAEDKVITLNIASKGDIVRKPNPAITADSNQDAVWVIDDIAFDAFPSVNLYETTTGEMVLADVKADIDNDEITITFRLTGDLSAGKYTAVIVV